MVFQCLKYAFVLANVFFSSFHGINVSRHYTPAIDSGQIRPSGATLKKLWGDSLAKDLICSVRYKIIFRVRIEYLCDIRICISRKFTLDPKVSQLSN